MKTISADFAEKDLDLNNINITTTNETKTEERTNIILELKKQINMIKELGLNEEATELLINDSISTTRPSFNELYNEYKNDIFKQLDKINTSEKKDVTPTDASVIYDIYEAAIFLLGFLSQKKQLLENSSVIKIENAEKFLSLSSTQEELFTFTEHGDYEDCFVFSRIVEISAYLKGIVIYIMNDTFLSNEFFCAPEIES